MTNIDGLVGVISEQVDRIVSDNDTLRSALANAEIALAKKDTEIAGLRRIINRLVELACEEYNEGDEELLQARA